MSKHKKFERIKCHICNGHGVVARYSWNDFEGPETCNLCGGAGGIIRYCKSRVLAQYPGGPFCGKDEDQKN